PEPAVKCCGALLACPVDGAVGPAVDEGADEAFGFAVGLGPVGARAAASDAERCAGKCVERRDVGLPLSVSTRSTLIARRRQKSSARRRKPTTVAAFSSGRTSA